MSGLSFGIISGVFSVINILADSIGPGIVGIHGDSPYYFITSGEAGAGGGRALFFALLEHSAPKAVARGTILPEGTPPGPPAVGEGVIFFPSPPQRSSPWPWFCSTPSGG